MEQFHIVQPPLNHARLTKLVSSWFGMKQDCSIELELSLQTTHGLRGLLGSPIQVNIATQPFFHGIILQVLLAEGDDLCLRLQCGSLLGLLMRQQHQRVFAEQTLQQILKQLLVPYPTIDLQLQFMAKLKPIPFYPQHQQSDYQLLQQIIQQFHLFYSMQQTETGLLLWLYDDAAQLAVNLPVRTLKRVVDSGMRQAEHSVYGVEAHYHSQYDGLSAMTTCHDLIPGQTIIIDRQAYQLASMQWHILQDRTTGLSVKNQLSLMKHYHHIDQQITALNTPSLITAQIQSEQDGPMLDAMGYYRAKMDFDQQTTAIGANSPALPMVQHYGGKQNSGWHHPLPRGSRVILACLNNTQAPMVLGALSHPEQLGVVTQNNHTQHIMLSGSGQYCLFDDFHGQQRWRLHNHAANFVEFSCQQPHGGMSFLCQQGTIQLTIANNAAISSDAIVQYHVGGDYELHLGGKLSIEAAAEVEYLAGNNIRWITAHNYHVTGQASLQLNSGRSVVVAVTDSFNYQVKTSLQWHTKQQGIQLFAKGEVMMDLKQFSMNNQACHLTADETALCITGNNIDLCANTIMINAREIHGL